MRLRGILSAWDLLSPRSRRQDPVWNTRIQDTEKMAAKLQPSEISIAIREPYAILHRWLTIALGAEQRSKPRVACIATVAAAGQPVTRMTNVEQINAAGPTIYTSLGSRLAGDISTNPHGSLHFHWPQLQRSVHIAGVVCPVGALQAQLQFARYSREQQRSMHGLPCQRVGNCARIAQRLAQLFLGQEWQQKQLPVPENWGGFLLKPTLYEFFQTNIFDDFDVA